MDQKKKEFLELKQGNMTVSKYEWEFVQLSKYAREWVLTEAEMCKCFEEGLNEDIKLLIGILEIREFAVLADRAHKIEELSKEKKQAEKEARIYGKRTMSESQSFVSKKLKKYYDRVTTSTGYSRRDRGSQRSNLRSSSPFVASPKSGVCFGCGSLEHFLRDCPERVEKEIELAPKPSNPVSRGRPPRHLGNVSGSRGTNKDTVIRYEA
ncbi:uncharacterized protein [Gossypium hirsutum]|uniref:CCHC-type domain-containing protein n=1 Tax=Gossypium hirsutum TaxID=3635 RepID=A0A1U8M4Z9_GOSHI|nr:uncharacterized protein LOC107934026 [Gossypium hirsutum]